MSPSEGIYYAGLMTGIGVVSVIARSAGIPWIIGLIGGFVAGAMLGAMLQNLYRNRGRRPRSPKPDDDFGPYSSSTPAKGHTVTCNNAYCNWSGEAGTAIYCPKCGEPLPQ